MQPDLFSRLPPHDGVTFDPKQDAVRLNRQQQRVLSYMRMMYPNWVSLSTVSIDTDIPEASVSARLRDLRRRLEGAVARDEPPRRPADEPALSLGAPFWYSALKKMLQLRSVVALRGDEQRAARQTADKDEPRLRGLLSAVMAGAALPAPPSAAVPPAKPPF